MHMLARARLGAAGDTRFVEADFKQHGWSHDMGPFDAVVTVQAVHELRHKRHAVDLHTAVYQLLRAGGLYLVCDHLAGPNGMSDTELYITVTEQSEALETAGFGDVSILLEMGGLVLHRGRTAA